MIWILTRGSRLQTDRQLVLRELTVLESHCILDMVRPILRLHTDLLNTCLQIKGTFLLSFHEIVLFLLLTYCESTHKIV